MISTADPAPATDPPPPTAEAAEAMSRIPSVTGRPLELPGSEEATRVWQEVGALVESALFLRQLAERLLDPAPQTKTCSVPEAPEPPPGLASAFGEAVSGLGADRASWQDAAGVLDTFHARLTDWIRERWGGASPRVAPLYLEGQLRAAVLTSPSAPGPYLQPLLLSSYERYADFCRRHGVDPSQLHRVLHAEGSISLQRLLAILAAFAGHGPGRTAYELRVAPAEEALALCRAGLGSSASPPRQDDPLGVDLDAYCRRVLAEISEGEPTGLPPGAYDRSYVLRVLHRKTPGSFRFFSLLTFPRYALVPRRLSTTGPVDDREAGIDFSSGW